MKLMIYLELKTICPEIYAINHYKLKEENIMTLT